ncbi:MAG: histidine kinase [Rhodovulum sulfidophilum]|uniref:histidine kinase n=1 Tax=Rhodovulum sulfidophilum TaxID=35806 RepID=A0A2W5QCJ7_RHOSU|nr:MAG: histidine kinase [Rhodovulum sulfidophilum]
MIGPRDAVGTQSSSAGERDTSMKRFLPLLALILIATSGLVAAGVVLRLDQRNKEIAFAAVAEQATTRLREHANRHLLLLAATAAHFEASSGWIAASEFEDFFASLDLPHRAPGSVGLGYLVFTERERLPILARAFELTNGRPLDLWPPSGDARVAVAVLYETVEDNGARASGFDSYSDPARREALDRAIALAAPAATAPTEPAREPGTGLHSVLFYVPVYASVFGIPERPGPPPVPTGFVAAVFRTGAFVQAAFDSGAPLPAHLTVVDAGEPDTILGEVGEAADPRYGEPFLIRTEVEIAGRTWLVSARPSVAFRAPSAAPFALALGALSLLLAFAVAATLREQARAQDATEALAATTQRNLAEKDLMLQEMKHRIKNAIGRVLAIARQTANGAEDQESFLRSFTQRLQAMSNAQDVLTRSQWQRADLGDLLRQELAQVFGADFDDGRLKGPPVELDERGAQALGLTFHELATNTLKYSGGDPDFEVAWHIAPRPGGGEELVLRWQEKAATPVEPPTRPGFGTRLIDANVRHELNGDIERDYAPGGLRLTLTIPIQAGVVGG